MCHFHTLFHVRHLESPARARPTRKSWMSGNDWQKSTERTPSRILLINPTLGSLYLTSSGPALPPAPPPLELLPSSVGPSLSAVCGRQRLNGGDTRIRSNFLPPSAPSAPPLPLADPLFLPQCQPPLPNQSGSAPQQGGQAFHHHTLSDPVGFQGSGFPALSFDRGSPSPRFTEIREDFDKRSRRAESRPPCRCSPVGHESPKRASTSVQTHSTDSPQRREYRTGVQPPNVQ